MTRAYPKDPEVLFHAGRLFGNYAYLSMQKLAEVAPDSVWRHEAAADAYQSGGNYVMAVNEYRQVLAQAPDRPGIHYRLGRTLLAMFAQGSTNATPEEAAKEFEAELALDPSNANAAYELAEIRRKASDLDKAAALFADALKYYPDFEEANVGLARTLVALGKPAGAIPYLKKATELNPRDQVAYYQLSLAYKALGRSGEQETALAKFQQLKSANPTAPDLFHSDRAATRQEMQ